MSKSTLVRAGDISRSSEIPPDSRLILDFGRDPYSEAQVRAWREAGFPVMALLAEAKDLRDPRLAPFLSQDDAITIRIAEVPTIDVALQHFWPLTRRHVMIELPLDSDEDFLAFKLLSSLGVHMRVPFDALRATSDHARDAMYDAMLRPGRRAPTTPFAEIQQNYSRDSFEIAALDYVENDHYVDLRVDDRARPRSDWDEVRVDQKRVPFLLSLKECAFCEGLLLCHGYLAKPDQPLDRCRAMMSELVEVQNLAYARDNAAQRSLPARTDARERSRW